MPELPQDPIMLYSVLNTKLRDRYSSLEDLWEDLNVSKEELEEKLKTVGFVYNRERNQFV